MIFSNKLRVAGAIGLLCLVCACSKQPAQKAPASDVSGAQGGVKAGVALNPQNFMGRQSPLIGLYVSLFMADQGGFFPVRAAIEGVMAQVQYHGKPSQDTMDDTYSLLEEFGTVLQVDVNDLLNRSDNRAQTLDEYVTGLRNITVRAQQRSSDLGEYLKTLQDRDKTQRQKVTDLQKAIQKALQAKDYLTLGSLQQDMTTEQTKLAQIDADLKNQTDIQNAFKKLLDIARQRSDAIDKNREVMVAGLKVVNVPGIQDLGILEGLNSRGTTARSASSSPFGGVGF